MMRTVRAIAIVALLAGCAPTAKRAPAPAASTGCDAAKLRAMIGKPYDAAQSDAMRSKAGARLLRVIRPGNMVTMDFREDRLNVKLDAADLILALNCG